jgi:endonuclease/exonuclease/phosphatase (EEP) superfamily protein YafD
MRLRWLFLGLLCVALLVPALMITGARLLQPDGGRWVRLVAFTPYATVLYAVAFLLALVAVAAGSGFWRKASSTAVIVLVPLLGLHLFWVHEPYVGDSTTATGTRFNVMAANLRVGNADVARVVEVAVRNDVDALVLSEITPDALTGLNEAGLSRAFPYQEGQAAPGVAGTMVFSKARIDEVQPLATSFNGYAMALDLGGAGTVQLLAVHPHPPFGDAEMWRSDHAAIRQFLAQNGQAAEATVIAGDFNATPDHEVIGDLEDLGFWSPADASNVQWQPTWPAAGAVSVLGVEVPSMLKIDHVLVNGEIAAVNTESVTIAGTDHRALVAGLTIG